MGQRVKYQCRELMPMFHLSLCSRYMFLSRWMQQSEGPYTCISYIYSIYIIVMLGFSVSIATRRFILIRDDDARLGFCRTDVPRLYSQRICRPTLHHHPSPCLEQCSRYHHTGGPVSYQSIQIMRIANHRVTSQEHSSHFDMMLLKLWNNFENDNSSQK